MPGENEKAKKKLVKQRNAIITNVKKEGRAGREAADRDEWDAVGASIIKLRDYQAKVEQYSKEILGLCEDSGAEDNEAETAAGMGSDVLHYISQLQYAHQKVSQPKPDAAPSATTAANPTPPQVIVQTQTETRKVELPKLEMEKFSGDATQWAEFWDFFKSTIHENTKLEKVDKLKYLKHFVVGDALRMLRGYELTDANYDKVVDAMQQRFGQKKRAIKAHFLALHEMQQARPNPKSLYDTYDTIEMHIRSLLALGVQESEIEMYTEMMLDKFPYFIGVEIRRQTAGKDLTLGDLRKLISIELQARADSGSTGMPKSEGAGSKGSGKADWQKRSNSSSSWGDNKGSREWKPTGTATALVSSAARRNQGNPKQASQSRDPHCYFCKQKHFSDECPDYPDIPSRKQVIGDRCYVCLQKGHSARNCDSQKPCYHCKKVKDHHRSICSEIFCGSREKKETAALASSNLDPNATEFVSLNTTTTPTTRAILQTALAQVVGEKGQASQVRILFDIGSTRSYVKTGVSGQIGAEVLGRDTIYVAGFEDSERRKRTYERVKLWVLGADGKRIPLVASSTKQISCAITKVALNPEQYPVLKQIQLAEPLVTKSDTVEIDLLIGCDYYYDIVGLGRLKGPNGLILLESKVGFIATGRLEETTGQQDVAMMAFSETCPSESDVDISKFWNLEEIGIKEKAEQVDDEQAMLQFKQTVQFDESQSRYAVKWPWKQPKENLASNYKSAFAQLQSNLNTLKKHPETLKVYHKIIVDKEKKEVIERVPMGVIGDGKGIHCLKHHCVMNPQSDTTPVRVVHNASAKPKGHPYSLNDCLYRGMVILEDLCGILIRFRVSKIGLVSDIEKAFLQISLQDSERDVTRFLWVNDTTRPATGNNLIHYRFGRVTFGVISSSFLLGATVQHHLEKVGSDVAKDMASNCYVDNIISGTNTVEKANRYYTEAKAIFIKCSMNIREWYTNSPDVRDLLDPKDRGKRTTARVLGVLWNTEWDTLACPPLEIPADQVTKRVCVRTLARLYDPCGYFSAVAVTGKIMIQEMWKMGVDWDEPLSEPVVRQWLAFAANLAQIPTSPLNRWLGTDPNDNSAKFQIHVFCDASQAAYGALVFLRCESGSGISADLIFAKTRVRTVKPITIPRLELLAVLCGVRLLKFVVKELRLPLEKTVVWTDSLCVLQWIPKVDATMPVFIENRLREIREPEGLEFCHVASEQNPADIASRGCEHDYLMNSQLWWHGPSFLRLPEAEWPAERKRANKLLDVPLSPCIDHCEVMLIATVQQAAEANGIGTMIDINRFSTLRKLLRTTAYVKRLCSKDRKRGCLSGDEINAALHDWLSYVQKKAYPEVLENRKNTTIEKQLKLFRDDIGLVRCQGRLEYAAVSQDANNPILLPRKDYFTELVIRDIHERLGHVKANHTLAQLRQRYWICQGKATVKQVIKKCLVCKRQDSQPFEIPPQPPLPWFRVEQCEPFQRVGVDYLGPLFVKGEGPELKKVWGCLFTCAVVRAIHVEVVTQLDAEQFLLSLRRFAARFGRPEIIVSDNATNFRLADRTIRAWWQELLESDETQQWASDNRISWKFVTEMAPWMGGFYESLIRLVKSSLIKTVGSKTLSLSELQTVVAEVEAVVNTRPLTALDDEIGEPFITPAHFLAPRMKEIIPTASVDNQEYRPQKDPGRDNLILSWKRTQARIDQFWKMWQNQYLLSLREKWHDQKQRNPSVTKPLVGMVVLIMDSNQPRGQWRLGKITKLVQSFDGAIKTAVVKTENGQLQRPIKLLVPLEYDENAQRAETEPPVAAKRQRRQPQRKAAAAVGSMAENDLSE